MAKWTVLGAKTPKPPKFRWFGCSPIAQIPVYMPLQFSRLQGCER